MMEFLNAHPWVLALAIFVARVADVSLGTLRTILVFRAHRFLAAGIGFLEVCIWVLAASHVLRQVDTWYMVVAFAGGFATGNVVGIWLEGKLAIGSELVRAVSENPDVSLARRLRDLGWSVTEVPGRGDGARPVEVLLVVERRRHVPRLLQAIQQVDPEAFCTLSDIRHARSVTPGLPPPGGRRGLLRAFKRK